jgi:hypothetical protein
MYGANRQLAFDIIVLSNVLDKHYNKELNFRNHCYLRIAFDATVNNKWDTKVGKPFIQYASDAQLQSALALLKGYLLDKQLLLIDNEKSLAFRKNHKQIEQIRSPKLF